MDSTVTVDQTKIVVRYCFSCMVHQPEDQTFNPKSDCPSAWLVNCSDGSLYRVPNCIHHMIPWSPRVSMAYASISFRVQVVAWWIQQLRVWIATLVAYKQPSPSARVLFAERTLLDINILRAKGKLRASAVDKFRANCGHKLYMFAGDRCRANQCRMYENQSTFSPQRELLTMLIEKTESQPTVLNKARKSMMIMVRLANGVLMRHVAVLLRILPIYVVNKCMFPGLRQLHWGLAMNNHSGLRKGVEDELGRNFCSMTGEDFIYNQWDWDWPEFMDSLRQPR